jgi:hypothetical protein
MKSKLFNYGLGLTFIASLCLGYAPLAIAAFMVGALINRPLPGLGASPFQEVPCTVVASNNYDTHGTITRATILGLTPAQLATVYGSGLNEMNDWFKTSFEMKACGTKTNGIYDWLMSSQRNVGQLLDTVKLDRSDSLLKPFIMARQDSVINKDFWAITAGWAQSDYTTVDTGPLSAGELALGAASDRIVRVVNRYGLDLDDKWFLDRDRVYIFGRNGGQTLIGAWKVMAAAADANATIVDVLLKSENTASATPFGSTPTSGILTIGGNNVNDFESWCGNRPTINPRKHVPFWYQTMRRARRVDSEYKKVFARLMESNEYFRTFGDLPLAERNRQDEETFQRSWVESFFFGKKISTNQTMALWQSLDQITTVTGATVDPGLGGKLVAYRANMIGVFEQMLACDRVRDLQNNNLNFYEWLDENYRIMRARKSQGRTVDTIDWFMDNVTSANLQTAFWAYMKKEYGDSVRINVETGTNELGFAWTIFKPKFPAGIKIAIITHEFFDDRVNAFEAEAIGSAGRLMLCLDIGKPGPKGGTIYPGMIATNRKTRTLGELEQLARIDATFACTMEHITEEISLVSETVTAIVECPANSMWIQGVADEVPDTASGRTTGGTGGSGSYSDLY